MLKHKYLLFFLAFLFYLFQPVTLLHAAQGVPIAKKDFLTLKALYETNGGLYWRIYLDKEL